ncbi:MAG: TolC family outer membrane protein [Campylobacterota bacterium]|nr:TolC family outer membrane protein [Campylobacterota bacterium]
MIRTIALSLVSVALLSATTLKQSVESTLQSNPVILERLSNYKETAKDLSIAKSEYLPTLDLLSSIGSERTSNENNNFNDMTTLPYYENSLTFMLNIFDGFGTWHKVDYQKARILAAAYNFVEKANDTAFDVTKTYISLLEQRELLKTAKENVAINEQIFSKVNDLYNSGLTTRSEVRKIESSLSLARSNLVVQQNNTMDATFSFKKLLGKRVNIDTLEDPFFDTKLPITLNEATQYSMLHNPSILVSNYNIKAAKYLQKQKKKSYFPKIDLMAQQNLDKNTYGIENERNRFRAGVVLSYNLYRGGADKDAVTQSISAINREVQTKNELQRQVIEGLELSWSAHIMIEKQLQHLREYKSFSKETLELYEEEYSLGRRSLLDLLSAQNDFINSKSEIIRARYNYLFAKYRILDSMGLLVNAIVDNDYDYMQKVGLVGVDAEDNDDVLPISYDSDNDKVSIDKDMCPASSSLENILDNGCADISNRFSKIEHFDALLFNSKNKMTSSKSQLNEIANKIKESGSKVEKIVIQSHSNTQSSKKEAEQNSKDIAKYVKDELINLGVNDKLIKSVPNSNLYPISTNSTLNNRAAVIMYLKAKKVIPKKVEKVQKVEVVEEEMSLDDMPE